VTFASAFPLPNARSHGGNNVRGWCTRCTLFITILLYNILCARQVPAYGFKHIRAETADSDWVVDEVGVGRGVGVGLCFTRVNGSPPRIRVPSAAV